MTRAVFCEKYNQLSSPNHRMSTILNIVCLEAQLLLFTCPLLAQPPRLSRVPASRQNARIRGNKPVDCSSKADHITHFSSLQDWVIKIIFDCCHLFCIYSSILVGYKLNVVEDSGVKHQKLNLTESDNGPPLLTSCESVDICLLQDLKSHHPHQSHLPPPAPQLTGT